MHHGHPYACIFRKHDIGSAPLHNKPTHAKNVSTSYIEHFSENTKLREESGKKRIIVRHNLVAEERIGLPFDWPIKITNNVIHDLDNDIIRSKSSSGII